MPQEIFNGQICERIALSANDQVLVCQQGVHVVSWIANGQERLFLSSRNHWDGHSTIRGGIPICFPQFNMRGPLVKHGFARNLPWQLGASVPTADAIEQTFVLQNSDESQTNWNQLFEANLTIELKQGQLNIQLSVINSDFKPLLFTGAMHTYFKVANIDQTQLTGLKDQSEWDSLTDVTSKANEVLVFKSEFDRVYQSIQTPLHLQDGQQHLMIEQSNTWQNTVVWNPGSVKCAQLADMPPDGYKHMLCVEAAQVFNPIEVLPGDTWQGWQRISVA
ncbi:MAG: D-hexose-6-phosphate mutarotase [Limnohabitans sp.]|nr:D-hexose-6-phosphate mutarotase [Limnohabitans sp.]